jgi:hypothetical protein
VLKNIKNHIYDLVWVPAGTTIYYGTDFGLSLSLSSLKEPRIAVLLGTLSDINEEMCQISLGNVSCFVLTKQLSLLKYKEKSNSIYDKKENINEKDK